MSFCYTMDVWCVALVYVEVMKKIFVIIDGHAIIHRAYHALPPLTTSDGTMVNAVFGFTSMLLKVMTEIAPDFLAVSFDVEGGTFRDTLFDQYKATREKADDALYEQIPLIYNVVRTFNIPIFEKQGYEADDVIGTIAKQVTSTHDDVLVRIVTGDQDIIQLIEEGAIEMYSLKKGMSDLQLLQEQTVHEIYGFSPKQMIDYKSLKGDTSDNIPGVPGIGEKTAKQLLKEYASLDHIYAAIEQNNTPTLSASVVKKLIEGKESAYMSHTLATIKTDVPDIHVQLDNCTTKEYDVTAVETMLKTYSFFSLLKRLPSQKHSKEQTIKKIKKPDVHLVEITDDTIHDIYKDLITHKELVCGSASNGRKKRADSYFVATRQTVYYMQQHNCSQKTKEIVYSLFTRKDILCIGHDVKKMIRSIYEDTGVWESPLFDIMIASYIVNSSNREHDIGQLVFRELGITLDVTTQQATLFGIDPMIYAQELMYMHTLKDMYDVQLKETNQTNIFFDIEMPLIPILARMEQYGIQIDTKKLHTLSNEAEQTIHLLTEQIHTEAGQSFNVASSTQLREILFNVLALPTYGIKKGKTGYSTAASELEKLQGLHPIIALIEEFREIEKLRNTYIDVLPTLVDPTTHRLHTTYNQAVAATGRLSSSDPNIQNIPIRTELGKKVRDTFISQEGYVLVAIDYSQIELRIAASLAQDATMIEIFKSGEDIHKATAATIHNVSLQEVTPEMRRAAKAINFGVLYGMGSFGLSARTELSQADAKTFIATYFNKFSGISAYMKRTIEEAKKNGYVETLFGRRRYIPELHSHNIQIQRSGERMAINMPIQGTQADMIKFAMIHIHNWIWEQQHQEDVRMLLQVHDELVFEIKQGKETEYATHIAKLMESVATLAVPIVADIHIGKSWGELK